MKKYEMAQVEKSLRAVLTETGLAHPSYAVVLPLTFGADDISLLVEVRAAGISQAGDPCFPGGRIEPGETPSQAAAREMEEELGIHITPKRLLGQLPTVQTYLGSRTDAFVCLLSEAEAEGARPNQAEVAKLLRVPLARFLSSPDDTSFTVDGHTIWGMTAGAIRYLCAAWNRAGLP